ncbi:hypothetical protein BDS110ZK25_70360 [Bradyrhizobium diazoefficiens]
MAVSFVRAPYEGLIGGEQKKRNHLGNKFWSAASRPGARVSARVACAKGQIPVVAAKAAVCDARALIEPRSDSLFRREAERRTLTGDVEDPLASVRVRTILHPTVLLALATP